MTSTKYDIYHSIFINYNNRPFIYFLFTLQSIYLFCNTASAKMSHAKHSFTCIALFAVSIVL